MSKEPLDPTAVLFLHGAGQLFFWLVHGLFNIEYRSVALLVSSICTVGVYYTLRWASCGLRVMQQAHALRGWSPILCRFCPPNYFEAKVNATEDEQGNLEDGILVCKRCRAWQRMTDGIISTVHCQYCNKCTLDFDHHCVFSGHCISRKNHHIFWWYLFAEVLGDQICIVYGTMP